MSDRPYVLVVEDDPDTRDAMALILELEGCEVAKAANGREALDRLRQGRRPGLIVLDLMMPVMDGWQFRREQVQDPRLASVPVLIVSAHVDPAGASAALGAAGVLQKPVDLGRLQQAVRQVWDSRSS